MEIFSVQAKHMVIPYMPMLIPPMNWTGLVLLIHVSHNYFVYMCCTYLKLVILLGSSAVLLVC